MKALFLKIRLSRNDLLYVVKEKILKKIKNLKTFKKTLKKDLTSQKRCGIIYGS